MNITATGLLIGLICGLLGAWLFLSMTATQHQDYRVQEASVACDKARFDSEFGGRTRKDLQARESKICADFDNQTGIRASAEAVAEKERAELQESIKKTITSKNGEASKTELAIREAASAVAQTAKEIAK